MAERFTLRVTAKRQGKFQVSRIDISSPEVPVAFDGYRILHLTDLHRGPATSRSHLAAAIDISKSLDPDLVLLTGDYVQNCLIGFHHYFATQVHPRLFGWQKYRRGVRRLMAEVNDLLRELTPPDGLYGVFGNHDHLEGIGTVIRQIGDTVRWLTNDSAWITRGADRLFIAGIDDLKRGAPDVVQAVQAAEDGAAISSVAGGQTEPPAPFYKVLLSHNPDIVISPHASWLSAVDLMLCGHTHGGQLCLPLVGPIITRTRQKEHVSGLNDFGSVKVYTNNGVGYGGLPIRTFCPPEIGLITFRRVAS